MRRGEFEAAWRISNRRRSISPSGARRPRPARRRAALKSKRVLIRCQHGLGDTIQFIRYAPRVKSLAAQVIVSAQPELIPLLQTMPAIDQLTFPNERNDPPPYDVEIEIMELPYALHRRPRAIPAQFPYFHVPKSALPAANHLAVGIVWAAGDWDRRRSIPLPQLAPLASVSGIKLFAFQPGAALGHTEHLPIHHLNWNDTLHEAALLRALDLLICVDSIPAHLAGALGVPVWLLLSADADWPWGKQRNHSPWYPTMRLFRQSQEMVWQPVMERVGAELRALARSHREANPQNDDKESSRFDVRG